MKKAIAVVLSLVLLAAVAVFGGSAHSTAGNTGEPDSGGVRNTDNPSAHPADTDPPAESSGVPGSEPPAEPTVYTLNFIGDITPDSVAAFRSSDAAYQNVVGDDYSYVFDKTRQFFEDDDFTIANFECVMSDSDLKAADKNFTFKCPAAYAAMLTDGSVEFVTLGNNHVLDFGQEGYDDTKAALDAEKIAYAGRDEHTIYVTQSGLKIGVYAVSFGTIDQIQAGIKALKNEGAEFIIAALHWGDEGSYDVNAVQRSQGHAAIDAGADIVYGSHPHTLEPVEIYNDKYIFYSMGNWSFGGNTNPRDKDTAIAKATVTKYPDGTVAVTGMEFIPCASSGTEDGNNYQPVPAEKDSERYGRVLTKLDGTFSGANLTIGYTYTFNEFTNG